MTVTDLITEDKLTPEQAETWMQGLLAEAKLLKMYEPELFPEEQNRETLDRAQQLRHAWYDWLQKARPVKQRIIRDELPELTTYREFVGELAFAEYVNRTPADEIERLIENNQDKPRHSLEEVRRELFG